MAPEMRRKVREFRETRARCPFTAVTCSCVDWLCIQLISLSFFLWQQQERQDQSSILLFRFYCLFCGPGSDCPGYAHFQSGTAGPVVLSACLPGDPNRTGPHKRRAQRSVQVSWLFSGLLFKLP